MRSDQYFSIRSPAVCDLLCLFQLSGVVREFRTTRRQIVVDDNLRVAPLLVVLFQLGACPIDVIAQSLTLEAEDDRSRRWSTSLAVISSPDMMTSFDMISLKRGRHIHLAVANGDLVCVLGRAGFRDAAYAQI